MALESVKRCGVFFYFYLLHKSSFYCRSLFYFQLVLTQDVNVLIVLVFVAGVDDLREARVAARQLPRLG